MNKLSILAALSLTTTIGCAQESATPPETTAHQIPPPATNATASQGTISIQEMLVSGPSQLKLYSLAMITQGKVQGEVDETYLPGLKACTEDPAVPLRSVSAQILGQHFVQDKAEPNPEALDLIMKLAKDESSYVRYNAVYYGLCPIQNKSNDIINLLVDIASKDRTEGLGDRIAESLKPDHDKVVRILNKKLADGNNVAIFEIYKELTGEEPPQSDKYLEMPSSVPYLFVFKGEGTDSDASKAELEKALKEAGIVNPEVKVSGAGENYVLLLKTYLTKDRLKVEKEFSDNPRFKLTQSMWLTPEMEARINSVQKK